MKDLFLLLAMAIGAIALGISLWGDKSGTLFGISTAEYGGIAGSAVVLAVLAGGLWLLAIKMGNAVLSMTFWAIIGIGIMLTASGKLGFF